MYSWKKRRIRGRVVKWAKWGVAHQPAIHYSQGPERMAAIGLPGHLPLNTDCSASVTLWCNWAGGCPDPNGNGYDKTGYTGTLRGHLPQIRLNQSRRGDLVVIGPGTGEHVVMLVQGGLWHRDPLVVSHGFEGGPLLLTLSQEMAYHKGAPYTVHNLLP